VLNVYVRSGQVTSLVNVQEMSADKYDESLHRLIASSKPLSSSKAFECALGRSLGFDIPPTKKYVTYCIDLTMPVVELAEQQ